MTDPSSLLAGLRVLVADDEAFSLSIIGRMLREMGCKDVVAAENGAKAYSMFQADASPGIKLAIIDFNMPDLNGLQILKLIRTGKTTAPRNLPVLMLTGTADGGLVSAAAALDIGAFVVKPVSKATLGTRVAKVLAETARAQAGCPSMKRSISRPSAKALLLSHKPVGGAKSRTDRTETAARGQTAPRIGPGRLGPGRGYPRPRRRIAAGPRRPAVRALPAPPARSVRRGAHRLSGHRAAQKERFPDDGHRAAPPHPPARWPTSCCAGWSPPIRNPG